MRSKMASMQPDFQLNRARIATLVVFGVCGIALSTWAPMVPYVKERLDLSESQIGGMLLFLGAGALVMMPASGWLISKIGSRRTILAAVVVTALALPALLATESRIVTGLVLFFFGAGLGSIDIAVNTHGVQIQNLYGKPIMSSLHGFFSIGGLVGPLLVILLFKLHFSPILILLISGGLLLLLTLTQYNALMNVRKEKEITATFSGDRSPDREVTTGFSWIDRRVFFLGTLCFIVFLTEGAVLDWSAIYLRDYLQTGEDLAGLGYASFSVAMAFMRLAGDRIVSKFPVRYVVITGSIVTAAGFLIVVLTPWFLSVLAGFVLVGLGAANIIPVFFSEGGQLKGIPSASALAAITTMGYAGQLAGPALLGLVAQFSSLAVAFGIIAVLMILVALAYGKQRWRS